MLKILTLIKNHLPALLGALALSALVASVTWLAAWNAGWRSGAGTLAAVQDDNHDLSIQVANYERERRIVAEEDTRALASAISQQNAEYKRAEAVTAELRTTQRQLDAARKQQKQRINDAVKNDSAIYTGIGPDSLRAWRASPGYSPPVSEHLPADSGAAAGNPAAATGTDAGLSPADILSYTADYGAWCMTLKNQLEAIRKWKLGAK